MKYRNKKADAFAMYVAELSITEICDHLNIKSRTTLYRWIKEFNWDKKKQEFLEKAKNNGIKSTKERHKKLIELIQNLWLEAVRTNKQKQLDKITARDLMEAIKTERLIDGMSTEKIDVNEDTVTEEISGIYERVKKEFERHQNDSQDNK